MRRWVVLAFLLVACSQTTGSPAPAATASPARSAATPIPDLPLTNVDLSCRLPVIDSSNSGIDPPLFAGGFVTFPAAALAPDSAGGVRLGSNGDLTTEASPTLHNDRSALRGTPFYDRAQRRWGPASPSQSTPDGAFYAYATWDPSTPSRARVHIVNVGRQPRRRSLSRCRTTPWDSPSPTSTRRASTSSRTHSNSFRVVSGSWTPLPARSASWCRSPLSRRCEAAMRWLAASIPQILRRPRFDAVVRRATAAF